MLKESRLLLRLLLRPQGPLLAVQCEACQMDSQL
jgi:hypothetical protein